MKGISPLIATILLIAFTIGVGGLISVFVTGLTKTSTGITSNSSEALTRCAGASVNVYSVTNSTVLYSNPNTQSITGIIAVAGDGKSITPSTTSLSPGASGVTSWSVGTNTSVRVTALCQSIISVEGNCEVGEDCWKV